jgi:hypothetical protein
MTEPRTVTISTSDDGDVTVPEPAWCSGVHEAGGYRVDIGHYAPDIEITTTTSRGPVLILAMGLAQNPFPEETAAVTVAVRLADGDYYRHDVAGLDRLADDLVEAARRVRLMGRRLAAETSRPGRRPAEPGAVLAHMARRLAEEVTAQRGPWADITPEGGHRSATSQQTVGPYVVRLQAAIYAGGEGQ